MEAIRAVIGGSAGPREIRPALPAAKDRTPQEVLRDYLKTHGRADASKRSKSLRVTWGKRKLELFFATTRLFHPDVARDAYTIHTSELSRLGTPALSIVLGHWIGGRFDARALKISCLAGNDNMRGREVVLLAKAIAQWVGCERIVLVDAAFVSCASGEPYDLSLYMLMRHGLTWYLRQGFVPFVGGVDPLARRAALARVERLAADFRGVSLARVTADLERLAAALDRVTAASSFELVEFEQSQIWKREKVVERHSKNYFLDKVRTVFAVRTHVGAALRMIKPAAAKTPAKKFTEFMVDLQESNCSLFYEVYHHLFDNEVYYWRVPTCAFQVIISGKPIRQELFASLQNLSRLVGSGTEEGAWMIYEIGSLI